MPALRKLPSGKWQASVRLPDGRRVTKTAALRQTVVDWARDQEAAIAKGSWTDPRSGRMKYSEWRERFMAMRVVEPETLRGDIAIMSTHIATYFDERPLAEIKPSTVKSWLAKMAKDEVGHSAQVRAFNLLRSSLKAAVQDEILLANPADKVERPKQLRKPVEWFTPDQIDFISAELGERDQVMVTLMAWCGLRWGECAGLRVKDVDWLRRIISVSQTITQSGRIKAYPKNDPSRRDIPAPPHVLESLSPLAKGRQPDDLLFVAPTNGQPINASNWRKSWYAAIERASRNSGVDIPAYSPHALRHTAASWLVQAGVPLSEIQRLLGHSTPTMTNRYAHLAPGAHSAVENAWRAMSRSQDRSSG